MNIRTLLLIFCLSNAFSQGTKIKPINDVEIGIYLATGSLNPLSPDLKEEIRSYIFSREGNSTITIGNTDVRATWGFGGVLRYPIGRYFQIKGQGEFISARKDISFGLDEKYDDVFKYNRTSFGLGGQILINGQRPKRLYAGIMAFKHSVIFKNEKETFAQTSSSGFRYYIEYYKLSGLFTYQIGWDMIPKMETHDYTMFYSGPIGTILYYF